MTHEQQLQQLLTEAEQVTAKMREALAKMEVPQTIFPTSGIWVFEHKNNGKVIIDFTEIKDGEVFCNFAYYFKRGSFYPTTGLWGNVSHVIPSTIRRPQIQELLELPDECPAKLRLVHGQVYYVEFAGYDLQDWIFKFDNVIDGEIYDSVSYNLTDNKNYCASAALACNTDTVTTIRIATPEDLQRLPKGHELRGKPKLATTYEEVVEAVKPKWVCMVGGKIIPHCSIYNFQLPTEAAAKQERAFIQIKNIEAYCAKEFVGERDCVIDIDRNGRLSSTHFPYAPFKFTKEAADFVIQNFPEIFKTYYGVE